MLDINNPGNIRANGIPWQGLGGSTGGFCIFDTMQHGLHAMAKILVNYVARDGVRTWRDAIYRWAPPGDDNPTEAYLTNVCNWASLTPDTLVNDDNLPDGIMAMCRQENGVFVLPFSRDDVVLAVQSALAPS